ncbi:MAG: ribonuclease R [Neomegalonema sp.]|nr:ribonuclease R [Neomegalonema sp.]
MPAKSNALGAHLPSKEELLEYIRSQPEGVGKREIARAFQLSSAERIELKRMLREMQEEGDLEKGRGRFQKPGPTVPELPPVTLLEIVEIDEDGDLLARPTSWSKGPPPRIFVAPQKRGEPALGVGDRFLGRLSARGADRGPDGTANSAYEARLIKKIGRTAQRLLGVYREQGRGGRLEPVDKGSAEECVVDAQDSGGARDGELVEAIIEPGKRFGLRKARIVERIGDADAPRAISLIAIREQGLPVEFPEEALAEAEAAEPLTELGERLDLRQTPLVTIDPADARDHDDAVFAEPDPETDGGWILWVAIADVAHYVRPGSQLDRAARLRGNSAYFPDRVVPMLPDRLSGDLCSLHEGVDRPCMVAKMRIGPRGGLKSAEFHRALMRSAASLTYEQAQSAIEGRPDDATQPLLEKVIKPLFGAYDCLCKAREARSPLALDLPERKVELTPEGNVAAIRMRERFDAHKLIEEFMILANVAAAQVLESKRMAFLYRVHEEPNPEKIESLRETLESVGIPLAKGQVLSTKLLNRALEAAAQTEHAELVNMSVLRAQTQAYYSAENFGHFGLTLRSYAHFTSPIRRYADLIVHRALISGLKLGARRASDGQTAEEAGGLQATAEHISMTERRAMTAERDTIDRYLAAYLSDRAGAEFEGRISGVRQFGLFVKLDESGADGFVPVRSLGTEYFRYDEPGQRMVGDRSGAVFQLADRVRVRLVEAAPMSGGLLFEILSVEGASVSGANHPSERRGARRGGATNPTATARRAKRSKILKAKAARKDKRKRSTQKKR